MAFVINVKKGNLTKVVLPANEKDLAEFVLDCRFDTVRVYGTENCTMRYPFQVVSCDGDSVSFATESGTAWVSASAQENVNLQLPCVDGLLRPFTICPDGTVLGEIRMAACIIAKFLLGDGFVKYEIRKAY